MTRGGVELKLVEAAVVRLRARIMAIVFGAVGGTGVFLATSWLLIRGGQNVGQHLNLLSNYFPGYRVTWPGAFIGFAYGVILGAIIGWALAAIYNWVAAGRQGN